MVQPISELPRISSRAIGGWSVTSSEGSIADSASCDQLCELAGVSPPTMLFADSYLDLKHNKSNFTLRFDAVSALSAVGKRDPTLQVRHAARWAGRAASASVPLCELPATSARDWTYTTSYVGTLSHTTPSSETDEKIDTVALRDHTLPIQYFSSVSLYEDELDDNGAAWYRVRIRCMPEFFFVLARFFLRIDGVLVRVLDIRYYHRYNSDVLIQETTRQQATYDELPASLSGPLLNDGDKVASELPVLERKTNHISLSPS